jgi:hypothetical protein
VEENGTEWDDIRTAIKTNKRRDPTEARNDNRNGKFSYRKKKSHLLYHEERNRPKTGDK